MNLQMCRLYRKAKLINEYLNSCYTLLRSESWSPSPIHVEVLTLNLTIFEGRTFNELIKDKRGHKDGALIQ